MNLKTLTTIINEVGKEVDLNNLPTVSLKRRTAEQRRELSQPIVFLVGSFVTKGTTSFKTSNLTFLNLSSSSRCNSCVYTKSFAVPSNICLRVSPGIGGVERPSNSNTNPALVPFMIRVKRVLPPPKKIILLAA